MNLLTKNEKLSSARQQRAMSSADLRKSMVTSYLGDNCVPEAVRPFLIHTQPQVVSARQLQLAPGTRTYPFKWEQETRGDQPGPFQGVSLLGGWTAMDNFASEQAKMIYWIQEMLERFHIYHDREDKIEILKVFTQVVSGVNYWILFELQPSSVLYWIQVYEPLLFSPGSSDENDAGVVQGASITDVRRCDVPGSSFGPSLPIPATRPTSSSHPRKGIPTSTGANSSVGANANTNVNANGLQQFVPLPGSPLTQVIDSASKKTANFSDHTPVDKNTFDKANESKKQIERGTEYAFAFVFAALLGFLLAAAILSAIRFIFRFRHPAEPNATKSTKSWQQVLEEQQKEKCRL